MQYAALDGSAKPDRQRLVSQKMLVQQTIIIKEGQIQEHLFILKVDESWKSVPEGHILRVC